MPIRPSSSSQHDSHRAKPVAGDEDTVIMSRNSPAHDALRASGEAERKFIWESLFESVTDAIVACDMVGRFVLFNPAAEAMLGRGATSDPKEKWSSTYGLYLPDGETRFPETDLPLVRALRGEQTPEVEMIVRTSQLTDGRWLRVRAAPIYDEQRRQTGAVAWFRDATEPKRVEQALESERRFLRHLIQTQDRDRQLTAFDLHDGIVQLMTGALMRIEAFRGKQPAVENDSDLRMGIDLVREAIEEARRMIGGMRPPVIDDRGIVGAIEYLADPANRDDDLRIEFEHAVDFVRLSALQESTLFRIVQEALHNTHRHSGSSRARVVLEQRDETIFLEIRDWGRGFDPKSRNLRRFGIRGIDERSQLLGGSAEIESAPGQGTVVRVTLPLKTDYPPDPTKVDL